MIFSIFCFCGHAAMLPRLKQGEVLFAATLPRCHEVKTLKQTPRFLLPFYFHFSFILSFHASPQTPHVIDWLVNSLTHPAQELFFTQDVVIFLCGSSIVVSFEGLSSDLCERVTHVLTIKFSSKNKTSQKIVSKKTSEVTICKFFQNGRCNKAKKECRFSHPNICHKFNQFGPKNGINNLIVSTSINSVHINLVLVFLLSFLDQGLDQLAAYKSVHLGHIVPTVQLHYK